MRAAVVWVASENYVEDSLRSAVSVRDQMPALDRVLVTDGADKPAVYTGYLRMPGRRYPECWYRDSCAWYVDALERLALYYDKLVFLDTDTYCAAPFDDLLQTLDRFDVLATHGAARHTAPTAQAIPDAFPELEIGLMAVAVNDRVNRLFAQWLALYDAHPEVYGNNDQGPFREALWNNQDVRLYVVPAEYHCRWPFGAQVCGRVRVLHSRNGDQAAMAAAFNDDRCGMRLVCTKGIVWRTGWQDV